MAIELVVPNLGESVTEVEVGAWLKAPGDLVHKDDPIVEIESDKATIELSAPVDGRITKVVKKTGETAAVGDLIGYMEAAEVPSETTPRTAPVEAAAVTAAPPPADPEAHHVMPSAQRLLAQSGLAPGEIDPTGPGGRVLKEDVQRHIDSGPPQPAAAQGFREEESVPMSPMRRRIAKQLVEAQQNAALLTTFNEADMSAVMELRAKYKDSYAAKYEVKLGFMSFFVKASIEALKMIPEVNAEILGDDIIYKNYYDIGIAVGGKKGLVVPVLRNAERMSFGQIELTIGELADRARRNRITIEELQGGTFTISNGGIYGSLLSTPIVNPPQTAILGLHAIQERPVVRDGQIVARPMMYLALTYDHRVVDGRGAVTFLKRIKECIEDPSRILLEI